MMPMSNAFCLICNVNHDISSCVNIFCTSFPRDEELLVNFISRVLRIPASELQDSYVCTQCYNLFQMLEQAQKTVLNIRCEILKIYHTSERRKNIKQSNEIKLNLNTNVLLEERKIDTNKTNDNLKEESSLQSIQFEEVVKQQIQNKITNQNINVSNIDYDFNIKINADARRNVEKKLNGCNEIDNTQSFSCNNGHDKDEILRNEIFCDLVTLDSDNNAHNIVPAEENMQALKIHIEDKNYISTINSEKIESKDFIKMDTIFSNNELQVEHIDFDWKDLDENVTEIKENTENTAVTKIEQVKMPMKSGKMAKYNLKPLKYSCSTCGKRWKTATELKTHIKTHSTLRPYMCEKCGQAYKHKHALEVHVGMHNGINPFQCNFCNKCFTQKGALMRHLPMHTGEMPYQCELCGKRFVHHTSYNMHRLSHSGKKSYKCHMCDLSLLSTSHLKRHMRVHTGEKPYSCTLCGKRFAERYNLFAHQKIHDPVENKAKEANEMQYQCSFCNIMFEQKENLNDHMKHHTNINNKSDFKKSCSVPQIEPENNELLKKIDSEYSVLQQTWIQMNHSKLDIVDNQEKFVLLQKPLPDIDENSFAVRLNDQKVSLESTNYNTNIQVVIEPLNTALLNTNLPLSDKMHM
ncbi:uncharacterized protein LOC100877746 isoform X1 [Megachile rotundata]|uniref:uncharacterized protein LOC100877746 isoform X1 n=1 Tax=Megachile rotundata TaxID=143995 RepID=UPI003FD0E711